MNDDSLQTSFEILGRFLKEDGWHPDQLEEKTICRIWFKGKNGDQTCYAQIQEDSD